MFCILSAGSNVARIVCVNRNMKIANSSHIKRFFHYFFCVVVVVVFFFAKEWRRKYAILRKQFKAISSYIGKLLKEEGYLFSDGSKRVVEMAGYWPSSFLAFSSSQCIKTQGNNEAILTEQP